MSEEHDHPHGHAHDHGDGHTHAHGEGHTHEPYSARTHPEYVVLEIGDGLGALIVHTDADLHGVEIEISATGADQTRQHKDVLERPLGGRPAFSAVFDQIPDGSYTLWIDDVARARDVRITDSTVAELDWRTQEAGSVRALAHQID
jgi:hypothetical protein